MRNICSFKIKMKINCEDVQHSSDCLDTDYVELDQILHEKYFQLFTKMIITRKIKNKTNGEKFSHLTLDVSTAKLNRQ